MIVLGQLVGDAITDCDVGPTDGVFQPCSGSECLEILGLSLAELSLTLGFYSLHVTADNTERDIELMH